MNSSLNDMSRIFAAAPLLKKGRLSDLYDVSAGIFSHARRVISLLSTVKGN